MLPSHARVSGCAVRTKPAASPFYRHRGPPPHRILSWRSLQGIPVSPLTKHHRYFLSFPPSQTSFVRYPHRPKSSVCPPPLKVAKAQRHSECITGGSFLQPRLTESPKAGLGMCFCRTMQRRLCLFRGYIFLCILPEKNEYLCISLNFSLSEWFSALDPCSHPNQLFPPVDGLRWRGLVHRVPGSEPPPPTPTGEAPSCSRGTPKWSSRMAPARASPPCWKCGRHSERGQKVSQSVHNPWIQERAGAVLTLQCNVTRPMIALDIPPVSLLFYIPSYQEGGGGGRRILGGRKFRSKT